MDFGDAIVDLDPARGTLSFCHPRAIRRAECIEQVVPVLRAAEAAATAGCWVVGFLAYEAAPAFDPSMLVRKADDLPLAWFAEYEAPEPTGTGGFGDAHLGSLTPDISLDEYRAQIASIREGIARGAYYQVSHTLRLRGAFTGDPKALYARLAQSQGGGFGACLHLGDRVIVSVSPELFFRREQRVITARPMKGTARRGRWLEEDDARAKALLASAKERAENVMIVDLVRNDLGRVADKGSVQVTRLFDLERWRTLLQMTSTIEARLVAGCGLADLMAAVFPCGSITGAPKIAAMAAIAQHETSARGAYCGTVGLLAPGGDAIFNVAIRTVTVDLTCNEAAVGIGGGITWDSHADGEYAEALAKAEFIANPGLTPGLIETLRLQDGCFPLIDRHLSRLGASAKYFGIPFDGEEIKAALARCAAAGGDGRVRLVVTGKGSIAIERMPLPEAIFTPQPVVLATEPVSRYDVRLFHKTTDRSVYERARRRHTSMFDVLLWNEEGEVTELSIGNLVAQLDGRRVTPPRDCGLLAGVQREVLLASGLVSEQTIGVCDVMRAEKLWLVNAVRGWVPIVLEAPSLSP